MQRWGLCPCPLREGTLGMEGCGGGPAPAAAPAPVFLVCGDDARRGSRGPVLLPPHAAGCAAGVCLCICPLGGMRWGSGTVPDPSLTGHPSRPM